MTRADIEATAQRIIEKHRQTDVPAHVAWAKVINEVQQLSLDDDDELTMSLHCYNLMFPVPIAR